MQAIELTDDGHS